MVISIAIDVSYLVMGVVSLALFIFLCAVPLEDKAMRGVFIFFLAVFSLAVYAMGRWVGARYGFWF